MLYGAQIASVSPHPEKVFKVHSSYLVYPGCLLLELQAKSLHLSTSLTRAPSMAKVFGLATTVYESNTGF